MSDTEAFVYRFSWDKELLQTWEFPDHYVKQEQALAYLEHVVQRHDLGKDMQFNTEMIGTEWDEERQIWHTETAKGDFTSRYIATGLGFLCAVNWPDIKGLHSFQGEMYHTARFPENWDFTGKRVAIIGNGSTGVQVMTELGKQEKVKSLTSFQRTPQYSVPAGDRPMTKEERKAINARYDEIWHQVRQSRVGFG
jgi:cation diffusion facilitator CzcD-associated flavoprotein CzcO